MEINFYLFYDIQGHYPPETLHKNIVLEIYLN